MNSKMIWGVVLLLVGLALLGYSGYEWSKKRESKAMFYGSLVLGVLLVLGGGYLIWKSRQEPYSKDKEN